ncbi:MAG TPA: YncE family protein [Terriglobales bacterium]|nr:YncE family protein [Terriglobales bacterium]
MTINAPALRNRVAEIVLLIIVSLPASSQTLISTIPVGTYPVAIAVNQVTNKIYIANQNSNNVTIINGATLSTSTISAGLAPDALVVNSVTNKVYIANANGNSVTVLDGTTNRTSTVTVGGYPIAIAANSTTNKIYAVNYYANTVTVIDGATNHTSTVNVGSHPVALAVNPVTNLIYVADSGSNDVTIINGANNFTTRVAVHSYPRGVSVDPFSNKILVANYSSGDVSIIDGVTNSVSNIAVGTYPTAAAVDPVHGRFYVTSSGSGTVTEIDEATLASTAVNVGTSPTSIDVDPLTNRVYLSNSIWNGTVTAIDATDDSTMSVELGSATWPTAIAVNEVTNTIYVVDSVGNSVSVIAGGDSHPAQFVPIAPCRAADTRRPPGLYGGPYLSSGSSRSFSLPQSVCGIPDSAIAYSINVTIVPVSGRPIDFVTVWPTGAPMPVASTMNSDGRYKANAAIVPGGVDGAVSVYTTNSTDVILDINGYFEVPGENTLQFYPLAPCRVFDTRTASGILGGPYLFGGQERDFPVLASDCQIPSNAIAYSMNFTVVAVANKPLIYLTVWPAGQNQPEASTLNNPTATVVANAAIVSAGAGGAIAAYGNQDTQLIGDINGYFAAPSGQGLSFYPAFPCRVIDTRLSGGPFNGQRNPPVNVAGSQCRTPATARGSSSTQPWCRRRCCGISRCGRMVILCRLLLPSTPWMPRSHRTWPS